MWRDKTHHRPREIELRHHQLLFMDWNMVYSSLVVDKYLVRLLAATIRAKPYPAQGLFC